MPKYILEFDFPSEKEEYKDAVKGTSYSIVLHEFDMHLRSKMKYEELSPEEYQIYERLRNKLGELKNEYCSD